MLYYLCTSVSWKSVSPTIIRQKGKSTYLIKLGIEETIGNRKLETMLFWWGGGKSQLPFTSKIFVLVYLSMVEATILWECYSIYLNYWEQGRLCGLNPHHLRMV